LEAGQILFYGWIACPADEETTEEEQIIEFLLRVRREISMAINVNIGTFVPKPHTPFQWSPQITEAEAHKS
jgi:radical SAM superfamily enzyme YgiQ (UPF0313 family)